MPNDADRCCSEDEDVGTVSCGDTVDQMTSNRFELISDMKGDISVK